MIPVLADVLTVFLISLAVVYACHRLRLPTVVGFLLTGALIGPHSLKLIQAVHQVETLAEVGVVLLLFSIGLEFSFRELARLRKAVLLGGSMQVAISVGLAWAAAHWLGLAWNAALFYGFLVALSSTAILLKLLQERAILNTPAGNASLGILLFQDLIVVFMLLATPLIAGVDMAGPGHGWILAAKGVGAVLALFAGARWVIPCLLEKVVATRNPEMFIIAVIGLCLGVAVLTWWAGLSLALGAFIAGLILAESPYGHQAVGSIMPMRDLFTSLFFVSIGMLFDFSHVLAAPLTVLAAASLVLCIKLASGFAAAASLRLPPKAAMLAALGLCQLGEFSFILAKVGLNHQLLHHNGYQLFLAVAVITMALSPSLLSLGQVLTRRPKTAPKIPEAQPEGLRHHVIIVGFGINGRNVALAARLTGIECQTIEMNSSVVRQERKKGENIFFGDASSPDVLLHAGVQSAKVVVITIADPAATRNITATVKSLNPKAHVIARTRFIQEVDALYELGADEVVPEEYEASLEVFTRVMRRLLVPETEIRRRVAELRARDYQRLRAPRPALNAMEPLQEALEEAGIATLRVQPGSSLDGLSLGESRLRLAHGVTVLAIRRSGRFITGPGAGQVLAAGDDLVILGPPERIDKVASLVQGPEAANP